MAGISAVDKTALFMLSQKCFFGDAAGYGRAAPVRCGCEAMSGSGTLEQPAGLDAKRISRSRPLSILVIGH